MVGPPVQLPLRQCLLGAHVVRGADQHAGLRQRGARLVSRGGADGARDPEVRHHGVSRLEQDVLRLDVAMDHAPLVRVVERVSHLARDSQRVLERQLPVVPQQIAQRLALHVRRDVIQQARCGSGVVDGEDVGVIERGRDLDLTPEALGAQPRGELRSHHLDGHLAPVLQVLGEMHRGHPPLAERALQPIAVGEGGGDAFVLRGHEWYRGAPG